MDYCPAHKTPAVLNKLKIKNIDFIFIPTTIRQIDKFPV